MQFATFTCVTVLIGLAQAGKISFEPGFTYASCGVDGQVCTEPNCIATVTDLDGCTGETQSYPGSCVGGPPSYTQGLCGSAEIVFNQCHDTICIDFNNAAGGKSYFLCPNVHPDGSGGCNDSVDGTCADIGLGNC